MKITTKGQVTIPKHIRKFLGVSAYSEVDFEIVGEEVILVKAESDKKPANGKSKFAALRGSNRTEMTTDAWMNATRGE